MKSKKKIINKEEHKQEELEKYLKEHPERRAKLEKLCSMSNDELNAYCSSLIHKMVI